MDILNAKISKICDENKRKYMHIDQLELKTRTNALITNIEIVNERISNMCKKSYSPFLFRMP